MDGKPQTNSKVVKNWKYRKYDDSYLDLGFTSVDVSHEECPQCVLYLKALAPECMLLSKLKRHLETNNPNKASKPRDYFIRKLKGLKEQKGTFLKQESIPTNASPASYQVADRVAKCKKPHTIAEELILPAAVDMVNIMVGEFVGRLLSKVPLSNSTISRKIQHIS
ncbi:SCAN domain-containing protein 3-like [Tachypleus tridentatus]|uniref:SCAN domain-containing protein 3-like n=1 Tax=Tachypleus tridentatus TaxID=6853 RepID=UPI003FD50E61